MVDGPLTGGHNAREVVRIGDTVRRSRGSGAGFAAQVLTHLEAVGFPYAPRHLGVDEFGRDILSFIPGVTTDHPSQRAPGAYAQGGRMLRALHDATAGHALAGAHECVIHGDPGPFNTIFQCGRPAAFIDWDSCRPGQRLDDLAYLAWTWCIQSLGNVPIEQQAKHLRELRDAYGPVEPEQLLDMIVTRQTQIAETETVNASNPALTPTRRHHATAAVTWATNDRALVHRYRQTLLTALS
ncbi:aminoglycoside phosphotransferase family protein [Plantactinospora sp. DSM 117369]